MKQTQAYYAAAPDDLPEGVTAVRWSRRGCLLGWLGEDARPTMPTVAEVQTAWRDMAPVMLPGFLADALDARQADIAQTETLVEAVLDGQEAEELLLQPPYAERLAPRFELLSGIYNEGDPQAIVKVEFDAVENGEPVAENLWVMLSWLSFEETDASLRFRFSFGMEEFEDVSQDLPRELMAAELAEKIFPESALISAEPRLRKLLQQVLGVDDLAYVERIVYFNAPDGGAQFHQDVERGHLGVVYAQVTGQTAWLACSKETLMDEIQGFLAHADSQASLAESMSEEASAELRAKAADKATLSAWMDERDNEPLEIVLNRVPAFAERLVARGYAYILSPGDVILLPQQDMERCAWHSVFCLGEETGEALSFAVRGLD